MKRLLLGQLQECFARYLVVFHRIDPELSASSRMLCYRSAILACYRNPHNIFPLV